MLTLLCLVLFFNTSLNAQLPNYMPVVQQQQRIYDFNNFMNRPMNFDYRKQSSQLHNFRVVWKDSTQLSVEGIINSDSSVQYLVWEDRRVKKNDIGRFKKIYPAETQLIVRSDYGSPEYEGRAFDTCWLFKAIAGKITGYSPVADVEATARFIRYVQKDNGPMLEMNPENLVLLINDNVDAMELFDRKKYEKAIRKYNKENK
jgi:hypothetical protein